MYVDFFQYWRANECARPLGCSSPTLRNRQSGLEFQRICFGQQMQLPRPKLEAICLILQVHCSVISIPGSLRNITIGQVVSAPLTSSQM
jgi:hypothetical protein